MWTEVYELAELLKSGKSTWEDLDLDDVDVRLKVCEREREREESFFFLSFFSTFCFLKLSLTSFSLSSFPLLLRFSSTATPLHSSGSASSTAGSAPRASS